MSKTIVLSKVPEEFQVSQFYTGERGIIVQKKSLDRDSWAITTGSSCWTREGLWEVEPMSSNRTDEYLQRARFTLQEIVEEQWELAKQDYLKP